MHQCPEGAGLVCPHTHTFGQLTSQAQSHPASAQSQLLGSGRQCGGPLKLGAGFHSTFHPVLPTGCRFPKESSFSVCLPMVCPRPGVTVIVRLENTCYAPLSLTITTFEMGGIIAPISDEETGTRELARLPGLELPAGFSQRVTQAGHWGRRRAFRSGAWLCASAQGHCCLAVPPTALGCSSFKKLHSCPLLQV